MRLPLPPAQGYDWVQPIADRPSRLYHGGNSSGFDYCSCVNGANSSIPTIKARISGNDKGNHDEKSIVRPIGSVFAIFLHVVSSLTARVGGGADANRDWPESINEYQVLYSDGFGAQLPRPRSEALRGMVGRATVPSSGRAAMEVLEAVDEARMPRFTSRSSVFSCTAAADGPPNLRGRCCWPPADGSPASPCSCCCCWYCCAEAAPGAAPGSRGRRRESAEMEVSAGAPGGAGAMGPGGRRARRRADGRAGRSGAALPAAAQAVPAPSPARGPAAARARGP